MEIKKKILVQVDDIVKNLKFLEMQTNHKFYLRTNPHI